MKVSDNNSSQTNMIPVKEWPINLYRKLHDNNTLINVPVDFESRLWKCVDAGYLSTKVLNAILFKYKYGMNKYTIASLMKVTTITVTGYWSYGMRRIMFNGMSIIDDIHKDPLEMTMRDLRLPVRLVNGLNRQLGSYGTELTVSKLIKCSASDLLANPYNGIGIKSIDIINEKLAEYNLKLKD